MSLQIQVFSHTILGRGDFTTQTGSQQVPSHTFISKANELSAKSKLCVRSKIVMEPPAPRHQWDKSIETCRLCSLRGQAKWEARLTIPIPALRPRKACELCQGSYSLVLFLQPGHETPSTRQEEMDQTGKAY